MAASLCRDKGWMWRWVGALCLSSWECDSSGICEASGSHPIEDRLKAPTSTPLLPLSLQDPHSSIILFS